MSSLTLLATLLGSTLDHVSTTPRMAWALLLGQRECGLGSANMQLQNYCSTDQGPHSSPQTEIGCSVHGIIIMARLCRFSRP